MKVPAYEEVFKIITFNMWLLGIKGKNVHYRFFIIFFVYLPIFFEESAFFVTKMATGNFVTLAGLVPCISYCAVSISKALSLYSKRSKIAKITIKVRKLYNKIQTNPRKLDSVRREIVLVQKLAKYLYLLNFMLASVYNFSTLVFIPYNYLKTEEIIYDLPFPIILPFSTDRWYSWLIVYVHSMSCAYICIVFTLTIDSLYFIFVTIVCVNFSILCDELQNLKRNHFFNLHDCIRSHQYLIKLTEELNDIFELSNFFNVFFGAIQICALGFCLTAGEWADVPGYLIFLSTVVVQIWTTSIFGENIITKTSKVNEAISSSGWYDTDLKTRKTVMFMIARSQKPQRLTAYLFSTVCMSSFRKILSNSWSYFSILRSAYKSPDVN